MCSDVFIEVVGLFIKFPVVYEEMVFLTLNTMWQSVEADYVKWT